MKAYPEIHHARGWAWLREMHRSAVSFLLVGAVITWAPATRAEIITNGGFEAGDFTGWEVELHAGNTAVNASPSDASTFGAQVLTGDDIFRDEVNQPGVVPPAATFFALLSTVPSLPEERPPGSESECPTTKAVDSGVDRDGDGNNELDVTTVSQTFTVQGPAQLSFTWSFLTSESEDDAGTDFHDIFQVTLTPIDPRGEPLTVMARAVGDTTYSAFTPLPLSKFDGSTYEVATDPPFRETDCAFFGSGRTPFVTSQFDIPASGTYRLTFSIGDDGPGPDAAGMDSGVLLDSVTVTVTAPTPTPTGTVTATPTKRACALQEGEGAECVTPTSTPTATHTPVPPTVIPSRTATATVVPATPTAIPEEGGGCSITLPHRVQSGAMLALLVPPALVAWKRRRRKTGAPR